MAASRAAPPGARLMVASLTLENFKSYKGPVTLGPFHHRFSAVVGPNGSGKSNVVDALQFVFGKKAAAMRLKRISELIHKSENHPDLEFAKVTVNFQDIVESEDGASFTVVPGSELVVARAVYTNETNKYFLNGRGSTYTEVTALLKERGIDLDHNRSMVLQGEVEAISMMAPKGAAAGETGLLEYLEDIIGTNRYLEQIDAAFKATEALNEERTSHLHRVKVVEKEREVLEAAKTEAEAFLGKQYLADVKDAQIELLARAALAAKRDAAAGELARLRADNQDKSDVFAREQAELDALAAALGKQSKEVDKTEAALGASKKEFELFERKDIKHREDLKHLKAKRKKAEAALAKDTAKLGELSSAVSSAESDLAKAQAAIAALTDEHAREASKLDAIYVSLKGETAGLQADIEQAQQGLRPHLARATELQSAIDVAASERALLESKESRSSAARAETLAELDAARAVVDAKRAELARLAERTAAVRARADSIRATLAATADEEAALVATVRQLRARAEESKVARTESDSRRTVLNALLAQKKKAKQFAGVIGRLGDLGTIDGRYDVAISTACPALENIVVDTTETAQACVAFLRAKNVGRATFVILAEQGPMAARMRPAPGVVFPAPRLFDLVRPVDEAYLPAFYHALRDTLVADSLDAAKAAAFSGESRHRVVTLAGELIDVSGTMSGGGTRAMRGLMAGPGASVVAVASEAAAVSPEELATLERTASAKATELARARESLDSLRRELSATDKELKALETAASKAQMDLDAATASIGVLDARLAAAGSTVALSEDERARIGVLAGEIAAKSGQLAELNVTVKAYTDEIASLQQQILDRGGVKLQSQKARTDALGQRLELAEGEATKASVTIKTSQKALGKAQAAIDKAGTEISEIDVSIASLVAEFKTIEDEAVQVMASFKAITAQLDDKRAAVAALAEGVDAKKKLVSQLKTAEVEFQGRVSELERALADLDRKMTGADAALGTLRARIASERADCLAASAALLGEHAHTDPLALSAEQLGALSASTLRAEVDVLRAELAALAPNMQSIAEFREKETQYLAKVAELDDISARRDAVRATYDELRKRRLDEFMVGFSAISLELRAIYQLLTLGGDAELELVDSLDPFSEGISFSVRPAKKSWKAVSMLSGGEKTLSSLSLIFALHAYKPTPCWQFDEIDAALDWRNVSLIGGFLREKATNAQFIVISLRNNMFELADTLVGIYKTENTTKSVAINPHALRIPLAPAPANEAADA